MDRHEEMVAAAKSYAYGITGAIVTGKQEESAADAILKALHKNQTARHYN